MLQIQHIYKEYKTGSLVQKALDDVSLNLRDNEFVAILGPSGSGKTTLLNIIGGLDRYDSGDLIINGISTKKYKDRDWDSYRNHTIGFVFQSYNLIPHQTVLANVELALTISGIGKAERKKRAVAALEQVGLGNQLHKKPSQMSGGQMQRVAIARALANTPKILLCDEATSALDPTTTKEILKLLQDINKQYGITIVIITHEMAVVQEICSHVAIIDAGELAEHGTVEEVFSRPQSAAARKLVFMVDPKAKEMSGKRCIRIVFTENSSFEPVIANMVLECKAPVNILLADTKDIGGIAHGQMILQLPEDEMAANKMIHYLQERKLEVEELKDYVG